MLNGIVRHAVVEEQLHAVFEVAGRQRSTISEMFYRTKYSVLNEDWQTVCPSDGTFWSGPETLEIRSNCKERELST